MPASAPSSIQDLWILLRWGGTTRKFLRLAVAKGDGSLYVTLGDPRRNARIAQGSITIPAGETSASIDYTKHIVATFTAFRGEHLGFKASGRVIHKFDAQYHPSPIDIPPRLDQPTLLQTIYPAPLDTLPTRVPRLKDYVAPDHFQFRSRDGINMEALFGADPFHVELWQMPFGGSEASVGSTVIGAFSIDAGVRPLIIAFVQDDDDRKRGWLPGGTRVLRNLG